MIDVVTEERVTIRELQRNTAEIFERVKDGHTVLVARWGEAVGQIVPPDPAAEAVARAIAQGALDPSTLESLPTRREALEGASEPLPPGSELSSEVLDRRRKERDF